jgi:hypothetical protein
VDFAEHGVAVFIYVEGAGGWWNKKSHAEPLSSIGTDGTWTTAIALAPSDAGASRIAAFLVEKSFPVPLLSGVPTFPAALTAHAKAQAVVDRARRIVFSGHEWRVKTSSASVGPGGNLFSDTDENVWVDDAGQLHLKMTATREGYRCAEVMSAESFGYGTYTFTLGTPLGQIDPDTVVLGFFTWSDLPEEHHREIDIEFTRWGDSSSGNSQFVVQPFGLPGNIERFETPDTAAPTIHSFTWLQRSVSFTTALAEGAMPGTPGKVVHEWRYEGPSVPHPATESVRMNLYLISGQTPPSSGQDIEVVITSFEFTPA